MHIQAEKQKENKSRSIANSASQKKSSVNQGFGFVDNRPQAVVQRTNRIKPTEEEFKKGVAAYKANKINRGKDYPKTYKQYLELFDKNEKLFDKKIADPKNFKPSTGDTVYHTTDVANQAAIEANGLSPKQIDWGGPDSSKDGVLSFAKTETGAGAMGGKSLRLKVTLKPEHVADNIDWWSMGPTELRTTQTFVPADIKKYDPETESWIDL
ncbi:MAG: hypothetical protein ACEPOZ_10810 [Marinifilaceae bacterium]